jgi:GIY-YIG catalytic domain
VFYVYVIKLADEAGPRIDPTKPCVYVGQSVRTPEERFAEHKSGRKASRVVWNYGVELRPRLYQRLNPIATRGEAERVERWLAERLRRRRYTVFGGH